MLYSCNEILYSSKRGTITVSHNERDKSHKHNMDWEKQEAEEHIPYDCIYIELQKQAKLICGIKSQGWFLLPKRLSTIIPTAPAKYN